MTERLSDERLAEIIKDYTDFLLLGADSVPVVEELLAEVQAARAETEATKALLQQTIKATSEVVDGLKRERDAAAREARQFRAEIVRSRTLYLEQVNQLQEQLDDAKEVAASVWAAAFGDQVPADWLAELQAMKAALAAIEWFLAETVRASKSAVTWPEPDGFGVREIHLERGLVEGIFRDALQGVPPRLNRNEEARVGLEEAK